MVTGHEQLQRYEQAARVLNVEYRQLYLMRTFCRQKALYENCHLKRGCEMKKKKSCSVLLQSVANKANIKTSTLHGSISTRARSATNASILHLHPLGQSILAHTGARELMISRPYETLFLELACLFPGKKCWWYREKNRKLVTFTVPDYLPNTVMISAMNRPLGDIVATGLFDSMVVTGCVRQDGNTEFHLRPDWT